MAIAEIDLAPAREEFIAEPPEVDNRDNDAPYGRKKDGTPAKRRGRQPGSRNSGSYGSGPRARSLETQIGGMLFIINTPLQLIPALQRDALDKVEITALAKAIDAECQKSPRFRKYVESALKIQGATSLVSIVGLIAVRRVVRHEIVPIPAEMGGAAGVDITLGSLISTFSGQGLFNPNLVEMKRAEEKVE